MQEEAQQQLEQKLDRLEHGISRGQTAPGPHGLPASVLTYSKSEKILVKVASNRPDTAYEGGSLPADAGTKTAASSASSQVGSGGHVTNAPSDTGLQDVDGVTQQSDATLAQEKLACRGQWSSKKLDRSSTGPEPPKKAGRKVKPSPRPRQAC